MRASAIGCRSSLKPEAPWFSEEYLLKQLHPTDLVLGLSVQDKVGSSLKPGEITPEIQAQIAHITRELAKRYQSTNLSTILTADGHLYFGIDRKFSHPNCEASSIECATGIAVASGHHSFPLVATYNPISERPPFNGVQLERLAEHFCSPTEREMQLVHVLEQEHAIYPHNQLLPFPGAGYRRPEVSPIKLPVHCKLVLGTENDAAFALCLTGWAVNRLILDLQLRVGNSTADGETRPGKKRHAACVFTTDGHVYFGVNLRSDIGSIDRCAEWNALSAAAIGGHAQRIAGVIVYSPDYTDGGSVSCCGRCRDSLGDSIDPALGDMLVVYASPEDAIRYDFFNDLKNTPYGRAERR